MLTLYLLCFNIFFTSLVIIFFVFSIIRLFKVKPICHWNFWIFLFQLHLNLLFYSLTVAVLILFRHILYYNSDFVILTISLKIAGIWSTFNNGVLIGTLILICVERGFATVKNKTYENAKNPAFVIVGLMASYGCGGINICVWNILVVNPVVANMCYYAIYSFLIIFIIFFYVKNRKLIKLSQSANIILSQRYQIHENVRMLKYAIPFLIYPSSGLIIVGTLVIVLRLFVSSISTSQMNDIYFTGSNFFILNSFYLANSKLISAYCRHMCRINNGVATTTTTNVKDDERRIEGDIYFAQFRNAW